MYDVRSTTEWDLLHGMNAGPLAFNMLNISEDQLLTDFIF